MRLDILLGVVTVLMAVLGGIVSVWPPKTRPREIVYVALFLALGIVSMVLIIKQSNETQSAQREAEGKAEREQLELRGKLDQSFLAQQSTQGQLQYTKGQLDSIALMVGKFGERNNKSPDINQLASAVERVARNKGTPPGYPHLMKLDAAQPGNFTIPHGLGCLPSAVAVQMTSMGLISLQPQKPYDATNIYFTASGAPLTAEVLIWCQP